MDGPERTCVGCRQRAHKSHLVRLVWKSAAIMVDLRQVEPGRGVYLHRAQECVEAAVRRRAVGRALKLGPGSVALGLQEAMEPWTITVTPVSTGSPAEAPTGSSA